MSATVNSIDQIRSSVGSTAVIPLIGDNKTPLADQLQFSSLLKTFVETPQEALSAVQGNKKPFDRQGVDKNFDDFSNKRDLRHRQIDSRDHSSELRSGFKPIDDVPRTHLDHEKPKLASITKDTLREATTNPVGADKVNQFNNHSERASIPPKVRSNDFVNLVTNPIAGTPQSPQTIKTELHKQNLQGTSELAGIKSSNRFSPIIQSGKNENAVTPARTFMDNGSPILNENFDPVTVKYSNKKNTRSSSPGAQTLAHRQAQDLAERLEQGSRLKIQVSSSDKAITQTSTPNHALTSNASATTLGLNGESNNIFANASHRQGTSGLADRQAPNNHFGPQNNSSSFNAQQDGAAAAFAQNVRVQAQAMGAQQSANASTLAPKLAPITADTPNISNFSGPNNLSQLSQGSKTTPSSAPRQPQKPPTPMEQVSVQIQRAVLNGADKINIKLHPAQLGRVEVRLDIATDGQLSAIIMAEKPETLELLQRDIKGLEKALQQAGLDTNLNSFNFGLKQRADQQNELHQNLKNGQEEVLSDKINTSGDEVDPDILMAQYEYGQNISTNGGIDIRI